MGLPFLDLNAKLVGTPSIGVIERRRGTTSRRVQNVLVIAPRAVVESNEVQRLWEILDDIHPVRASDSAVKADHRTPACRRMPFVEPGCAAHEGNELPVLVNKSEEEGECCRSRRHVRLNSACPPGSGRPISAVAQPI